MAWASRESCKACEAAVSTLSPSSFLLELQPRGSTYVHASRFGCATSRGPSLDGTRGMSPLSGSPASLPGCSEALPARTASPSCLPFKAVLVPAGSSAQPRPLVPIDHTVPGPAPAVRAFQPSWAHRVPMAPHAGRASLSMGISAPPCPCPRLFGQQSGHKAVGGVTQPAPRSRALLPASPAERGSVPHRPLLMLWYHWG